MALNIESVSWDDIKLFLLCARVGSFRAAAQQANLTPSTILRRMDGFEREVGVRLFDRANNGLVMTDEGARFWRNARRLEDSAAEMQSFMESFDSDRRGAVKIFASEGLGAWWLTPRLAEFLRASPLLSVHLKCGEMTALSGKFEPDALVHFIRPALPDVESQQIGTLHVFPFAARSYIERYGRPEKPEDIARHRIVDQANSDLDPGLICAYLNRPDIEELVSLRTNSSSAHLRAIEEGAGIGVLPSYSRILGAKVEPVDMGVTRALPIWLSFRPTARKTPRVAAAIDWLISAFDSTRYPWFSASFIHPLDLERMTPHDRLAGQTPDKREREKA